MLCSPWKLKAFILQKDPNKAICATSKVFFMNCTECSTTRTAQWAKNSLRLFGIKHWPQLQIIFFLTATYEDLLKTKNNERSIANTRASRKPSQNAKCLERRKQGNWSCPWSTLKNPQCTDFLDRAAISKCTKVKYRMCKESARRKGTHSFKAEWSPLFAKAHVNWYNIGMSGDALWCHNPMTAQTRIAMTSPVKEK